jgi:hypothetical protein
MTHHLELYPPQDFLSDSYRSPGADSTMWRFLVAGVALAALFLWLAPLWLALPVMANLAVIGFVNSYVHDATHIRGHWLERFTIYKKWRALHFEHHLDMGTNYGIVTFLTDRVMRTFRS